MGRRKRPCRMGFRSGRYRRPSTRCSSVATRTALAPSIRSTQYPSAVSTRSRPILRPSKDSNLRPHVACRTTMMTQKSSWKQKLATCGDEHGLPSTRQLESRVIAQDLDKCETGVMGKGTACPSSRMYPNWQAVYALNLGRCGDQGRVACHGGRRGGRV